MDSIKILGVKINNVTMDEAVDKLWEFCGEEGNHAVFTPNPEFVYRAYHDPDFRDKLNSADLIIPDGIGLIYAAKIIGTPLKERVPGFEVCCKIIDRAAEKSAKIFILGGKPGVAELAKKNLERDHKGINVVGVNDGYFKDDDEILNELKIRQPRLVLCALGSPKQEEFILKAKELLPDALFVGVGGSFDVWSGVVERAPEIYQKLGLEWLYRTVKEPKRFKRIFPTLPLFVLKVLREKFIPNGV